MNLRFINITTKVSDNETMSRKDNLRHQSLEAHPHNGGHGKSNDDNDGDVNVIGLWSKGAGGFSGSDGLGGNGEINGNCCHSLAMGCVIQDNDPRVHYGGPWVLKGTKVWTTHNTVVEGSTVSLIFNGKFY